MVHFPPRVSGPAGMGTHRAACVRHELPLPTTDVLVWRSIISPSMKVTTERLAHGPHRGARPRTDSYQRPAAGAHLATDEKGDQARRAPLRCLRRPDHLQRIVRGHLCGGDRIRFGSLALDCKLNLAFVPSDGQVLARPQRCAGVIREDAERADSPVPLCGQADRELVSSDQNFAVAHR
jgi:hypothetical protein